MERERLNIIYWGMKGRCLNVKHVSYKYYGARGISICDGWIRDYQAFKSWALLNGYADTLTLDRRETLGNYKPDNCRWVTKKEQQSNRRDNIKREFDGKMLTTGQICEITGKSYMSEYLKSSRLIKKQRV